MKTTFKKGNRVRLKAWGRPIKNVGLFTCTFDTCDVGLVSGKVIIRRKEYAYVQYVTNEQQNSILIAIEDLELMPEQQVHIVKDGKVYELRKKEPSLPSCNSCDIMTSPYTCRTPCPGYYNYKEVKSGKLVS